MWAAQRWGPTLNPERVACLRYQSSSMHPGWQCAVSYWCFRGLGFRVQGLGYPKLCGDTYMSMIPYPKALRIVGGLQENSFQITPFRFVVWGAWGWEGSGVLGFWGSGVRGLGFWFGSGCSCFRTSITNTFEFPGLGDFN